MKHRVRSLFYWDSVPNFGDMMGPDIVRHVLGTELPKAQPGAEGVLFSCGSIIHCASRFTSTIVWGSGYDPHYGRIPRHHNVAYCAVRGPLTAEATGYDGKVFGDPAILAPRIHPRKPTPVAGRIGVVVHHSTMRNRLRDRLLFNPHRGGFHVIDPRKPWRDIIDEIVECEFVFCQSLHGAIMCEAYGVPWAWWKGYHGRRATFKWRDWFASIGARPESFGLGALSDARRSADRRRSRLPDPDRLEWVLTESVEATV